MMMTQGLLQGKKSSYSEAIHLGLDVAGMIPGIGIAADVANAGYYLYEGDYTGAALSGAAAIPLGGLFAGGAKLFRKGFKYLSKACSFTRGTRVETYLGLEPIEEIPEDRITQAKDEITGELKWARVVNTFAEWHEEVIALEILGPNGFREEIVTTTEHPFFLADRGWTPAEEIRESDRVVLRDDGFGEVLKVEVRNEPQMAYNLDVEEVDTYLVGELGVWVHNACKIENHHIIQQAAVRILPGYSPSKAPTIPLGGPGSTKGTQHYKATRVQEQRGGGNYAAERRIGYKAMRRAGVSKKDSRKAIKSADSYFESLGVGTETRTRIPLTRN